MNILNAVMVPHPPLILPEIGRGEETKIQATVDAYHRAARFVADAKPDTIVVTTPHSAMYADWFHISPGAGAKGSFSHFGAGNIRVEVRYDEEFVRALCGRAWEKRFPAGTDGQKDASLDHATMIPLRFLREAYGSAPLPPIARMIPVLRPACIS
ncbi:MAG TPA: class III extradiol dioxygenase subunit B-like domain-containing protein, partial [Clostridia bacterium]|nr:class III extradiol dioxygenase subunit B-like domain-containing protein [Clostridia bacterium]